MSKELQVYAITQDDGTRLVVASPAKVRAAKLLGVTPYILSTRGEVTNRVDEYRQALSDPGAVWARPVGAKDWVVAQDSAIDKTMPARGGKREGAGRNRLSPSGIALQRGFRMDDEAYARFMDLGGVKFMRKIMASGIDLSDEEWAVFEKLGGGTWLREQIAAASKNLL